jgi:REP element-mobilizing transposase RayT
MARPLRIQFPGAFYHVMSRGNGRQGIFLDDSDRLAFLRELSSTATRLHWRLLAYCLMVNHYHLALETADASLATGMRNLNSWYGQAFNRRHDRVGHVFQGRYKAILVERPGYLLELARYIVLNPVRAGLCATASDWPWSSHRALLGQSPAIGGLDVAYVLRQFDGNLAHARAGYVTFVAAGAPSDALGEDKAHPVIWGSSTFVADTHGEAPSSIEIPRLQRARLTLVQHEEQSQNRDAAIRSAYATGHYSLTAIGRHFGLHYSTVSKICRTGAPSSSADPQQAQTSVQMETMVDADRQFKI